ncbi:protein-glutamate methylesterase/protein-glutamine glutaminase [Planctomicrobium sp. SH661]|uniref:protein-glutamate methylesterase/protein-glutamine glutaminase n=1 Tax=Planctomicrobium sp. SH661 TaxID=3448124 RepID=UPI003F5B1ECF
MYPIPLPALEVVSSTNKVRDVLRPLRILLADDSMVIRRILVQALSRHVDLTITGVARWGGEAIELLDSAQPDVVLLDVEMPGMNGVEAAEKIRSLDRTLPIIMFSSLTVQGGNATFEAMARGANDYVAKPRNIVNIAESLDLIDSELVTKIRFWGEKRLKQQEPAKVSPPVPVAAPHVVSRPALRPGAVELVVIGVSTGGPNALADVLPTIPRSFPVPVLVVQHMPPVFTQLLANRLQQTCPCPVREAVDEEPLTPGTILIAPGNQHMQVCFHEKQMCVRLNDGPLINSCRPAVDLLFRSAAELYGKGLLAVVLTGMGKDGLEGAREVKRRGGRVIAQDQESSVVWGMPRAVAEAGLADLILPLNAIGPEILQAARPVVPRLVST